MRSDHPETAYLNPIAAFRAPQPPCPSSPTNPLSDSLYAETSLLTSPRFNKGAGFPASERTAFGLIGRLPYRTNTLDEQCERAYEQLNSRDSAIRKNTFLQSLKEQNWTLYYSLLARHLKELVPVIYTPTEVSESLVGLVDWLFCTDLF
jgi:hypothetical protein